MEPLKNRGSILKCLSTLHICVPWNPYLKKNPIENKLNNKICWIEIFLRAPVFCRIFFHFGVPGVPLSKKDLLFNILRMETPFH